MIANFQPTSRLSPQVLFNRIGLTYAIKWNDFGECYSVLILSSPRQDLETYNMASNCFFCSVELWWTIFAVLISCFVYRFTLKTWWFFDNRNVKYHRGIPLLGSFYRSIMGLSNEASWTRNIYNQFPSERFIGIYDMMGQPSYLIRDPDLVMFKTF